MKKNSAGALLFAIITAFVILFISSTIILLATNQYRVLDDEIDRTIAFYRLQAGMENAVWFAYTNPGALPQNAGQSHVLDENNLTVSNVTVTIKRTIGANPLPFQQLSSYGINVTTDY